METKRLFLRLLENRDKASFIELMNDDITTKFMLKESNENLEQLFAEMCQLKAVAIVLKETNQCIGHVGMDEEQMLYWAIYRDYWQQGYATEALCAYTNELPRPLYAYILKENSASLALAHKLKMSYVSSETLTPSISLLCFVLL